VKAAPALAKAVTNQRRAVILAIAFSVAAMWIAVPIGRWQAGLFVAAGIVLGLVNHVLTELSLLLAVEGDDMLTRRQFAVSSFVRLMAISFVAVVLAVAFWPAGAMVLVGLAFFHLVTLVFTGLPLLKEIRKA
jgi:hypothetical protein